MPEAGMGGDPATKPVSAGPAEGVSPSQAGWGFRRSFLGRTIMANLFWSIAGVGASKAIRFAAMIFCIRQLGSHEWGQIAATYVTITFVGFAVDQGLAMVPPLHRVGARELDRLFISRLFAYRSVMAVLCILGLFAWHRMVHPADNTTLLFSLVLVPRALNLDWWFQRRQLYQVGVALNAIKVVFFAAAALILVRPGVAPEWVVGLELATETLGTLLGFAVYRAAGGSPRAAAREELGYRTLLRLSLPMLAIGLLNTIHQSVDILFLQRMAGYEDVGRYDVGYKIGYFMFFLGATLIQIIRPKLTLMHESGRPDRMGDVLVSSCKLLSVVALAFLAISLGYSSPIMAAVFKQESELTRFVFQWAPVWVATAFLTMVCADTLLCIGRTGAYLRGAALCAAVNIAANFILIAKFHAYGALFATLAAEAVFLGCGFMSLPDGLRKRLAGPIATQAAALAVMAVLYLGARGAGLQSWFAPAALLFVAALAVLQKTFGRGNLAVLRSN